MWKIPEASARGKVFFKTAALVSITTFGAGIFALPYVFLKSGWLVATAYLLFVGFIIITSQKLYFRVLQKTDAHHSLLGLVEIYFGRPGYWFGIFAVTGGLFFGLVVYLILGQELVQLFFPSLSYSASLLLFWFVSTLPILVNIRRFVGIELFGGFIIFMSVLVIAFAAISEMRMPFPVIGEQNIFYPFGVMLFSLAGWTAILPAYLWEKKNRVAHAPNSSRALEFGTWATALLYLIFVFAIAASATTITNDTFSGLIDWPPFLFMTLLLLGVFSIWTSYSPVGWEAHASLHEDLKLSERASFTLVVFLPLILVLAGFNNFFAVLKLSGGVFLGLQYILILLVSKKALTESARMKLLIHFMIIVFAIGAIYEFYYFIVR